jgi:hypothetical protein
MNKILIDSGPLIALFDKSDKYHVSIVKFLKENKDELVTSFASITETLYLLDFNVNAQLDFLEWVFKGAVLIENIANKDFAIIRTFMNKYKDLPIDFADACLILLSEKLKINRIITIDGDFNIYRTCGKKFKILP